MKILQVNKFFYVRGGSERYYFDLCDLLTSRGHAVNHFSMRHGRNRPSADDTYFVSTVDFNSSKHLASKARAAARILYSREAKIKIGRLMDARRPDLVHFHNISRQLSPSIIDAAVRRGIPTVQTLHDWSLICPAHTCLLHGVPCEACERGAYWHVLPGRCIDGSTASSMLGCLEAYLHAWLGLYKKIKVFIAPSLFLRSKVSSLGWIGANTKHLPYFIPLGPDYSESSAGYVLFTGRLSAEKGVAILLDAASMLREIQFVLAGEGPEADSLRAHAARLGLENVRFAGFARGEALEGLIKGSSCVVVPSIWYENLPLSILEAFARGKPVVAADSGGIPELVRDGITGYLFDRGVAASLADSLGRICSDEGRRIQMGRTARAIVSREYSPESHYKKLMAVYGEAVA